MWDQYLKDNLNKLLVRMHRKLTVAQFAALASDVEDRDEVYLEVDSANAIEWHLRYDASEATYKWRFLGGSPLTSFVATSENVGTNTTYVALGSGPAVAVPRSGDYLIEHGNTWWTVGNGRGYHSFDRGATAAVDADAVETGLYGPGEGGSSYGVRRSTLAIITLTSKYRIDLGGGMATNNVSKRFIQITPHRIKHDG